jgi:hypothetical protein
MKDIIDWIDKIIEELVDPQNELRNTLLKVQVLAFKLKNDNLKEWVNNELNGYVGKKVPEYRIIPSAVIGNLIQDGGFGSYSYRKNTPLPVEVLGKEIMERLISVQMTSSVAELEKMLHEKGNYQINIPYAIFSLISQKLSNGWQVDGAWQKISITSVEGIISSIKSNLLNFLLEINEEIGGTGNFSIMDNKRKIDQVFERTIGSITGQTVNVTIGNENQQTVNTGAGAKLNTSKGDYNTLEINDTSKAEMSTLLNEIKDKLDLLGLNQDDKEDVLQEISRVETQLTREKPKVNIIREGLSIIQNILLGVATNAYTPIILEQLQTFVG